MSDEQDLGEDAFAGEHAERMYRRAVKAQREERACVADAIVADLFKNGAGQEGQRLVLEGEDRQDLGGWCRGAVRDRILRVLEGDG